MSQYRLSHLKDWEDCDPVFMLKEIWENGESQYPVSSSNPQKASADWHGKGTGQDDKKRSSYYDKWGHSGYTIRAINVQPESDDYQSDSLSEEESDDEYNPVDPKQEPAYHISVTNMADEMEELFGKCYNCREEGHPWQDCKKLLKPSVKMAEKNQNEREMLDREETVKPDRGCWSEGRPHCQGVMQLFWSRRKMEQSLFALTSGG